MFEITGTYIQRRFMRNRPDDLHHVYFSSASADTLEEAVLEAVRQGVALGGRYGSANLEGLRLPGADLRGAKLAGCPLIGADLRGANLSGAELGVLWHANLAGASLQGVVLGGFAATDLSSTDCSNAIFPKFLPGPYGTAPRGDGTATLDGADVRGAGIHYSQLERVDFTACRNLASVRMLGEPHHSGIDGLPSPRTELGRRNWAAINRARAH